MSKQITYTLRFSANACKLLPSVNAVVDGVNRHLTTMGVPRIGVRAQCLSMDVSVARPITKSEKETFMKAAESSLNEGLPELSFRCESMRRKSRNSRSQSV